MEKAASKSSRIIRFTKTSKQQPNNNLFFSIQTDQLNKISRLIIYRF